MAQDQSVPTLCRYRIKPGREKEFNEILQGHWKTLHNAGLTTDEPARVYRADDKAGNVAFIEMFSWKTGDSAQTAHETPAVMSVWEPMGALSEDMEFWQVESLNG